MQRKTLLKAAGVLMFLPKLESFSNDTPALQNSEAQRIFIMSNPLGMVPDDFHPHKTGKDYDLPELLQPMKELKDHISIISHLDHDMRGGHEMTHTFLSGIHQREALSMPHGNVSLDQWIAKHWIGKTRFPYLATKAGRSRNGGFSSPALSWTEDGVHVPPIDQARVLFNQLFIQDSQKVKAFKQQRFKRQSSILDAIFRQAKELENHISQGDKQYLDQYFTSIRSLEKKMQYEADWNQTPKPRVDFEVPTDETLFSSLDDFFELIFWAFKTDQTRVATLEIPGDVSGREFGLSQSYHTYSHHGRSEENLKGVKIFERFQMEALAKFIERMKNEADPQTEASLLDSSLIVFGSGMSNASAHTNTNLPLLLAGSNFHHGKHHSYAGPHKPPLSNLWLSLLHKLGFEDETFGRSTSTLEGFVA